MTPFRFIPRNIQFMLLITLCSVTYTKFVNAENLHQKAELLAKAGDITGMGDTYLKILKDTPSGDLKAQLGYATAQSWQGHHEVAQDQFRQVLKQQPDNLDALIGLGYDFAWSRQFKEAESQFNKVLVIVPDNVSAQKGLAFSSLWNEQPQKALDIFQSLEKQHPNDAEIFAAEGQALLALNNKEEATIAFQRALIITPGRPDAIDGLATINKNKKTFDFVAWAGDSSNGGDSGLREVIVGYWIKDDLRIWARYDNSLSLDNPALVRSGEKAETYYLGVLSHIHQDWQANLEIGNRDLPNDADQQIYKLEGIKINKQQQVFKLGVQLSPHSENYTDKLIYSAYGFPVSDKWRLEPSLYLSSSGTIDDKEWRAALFGEYALPDRWSVGVSAGVGRISSDIAASEGSVFTSNVLFSYPISQKNRLNLSVRYEDSPSFSYTTMLIGIAIQLP
jgi:tetratricopeptide (TPR) repeat protein